jgi:hypothetical protein
MFGVPICNVDASFNQASNSTCFGSCIETIQISVVNVQCNAMQWAESMGLQFYSSTASKVTQ